MDTWTSVNTITQTVYHRDPTGAPLELSLSDLESTMHVVDVAHADPPQPAGRLYQRLSDHACFFFPSAPPPRRHGDLPLSAAAREGRVGYPVRLFQFAPPRYWRLRSASYGRKASALLCAPSEESACALFAALAYDAPDSVEEVALHAGVLLYEHEDWDDPDD